MIRLHGSITVLSGLLAAAAFAGESWEPSGGLVAWVEPPEFRDSLSAAQEAEIQAAIAAYAKRHPAAAGKEGPFLYPVFPQAGILGQDLFLNNFTDQNPSSDLVRDWDCSEYTYDGHRGHDSLIRSFREQEIGVPVFAVRGGVVVETHDGEPDMNTRWNPETRANLVIIDHGGGYFGRYLHFKRGSVAVSPGQEVTAGTQLGLTGSSGFSDWPHLHFETQKDGQWLEPSAGPCRTGDSLWLAQPPVARDFYVADFYMASGRISIPDAESFFRDEVPRTGTFVKGIETVSLRADLRNVPARAPFFLRVLTPRGKVAFATAGLSENSALDHLALGLFTFQVNFDVAGIWRLQLEIGDELAVDVPFRVVAAARQRKNRPPSRIAARLAPPEPVAGEILACEVQTSLVTEDPDFDLVSYRYEWQIDNHVVRSVNAALVTDLLPAGTAQPGDRVRCRVVPADGKSLGKAAVAVGSFEEP